MQVHRVAMGVVAVFAVAGCAALQSAQQGLGQAQEGVDKTTGEIKKGEEAGKKGQQDAKDRMGKKKGGAAAADAPDPDGDGGRAQAKEGKSNEAITDEVDPAKGDRADWRVFDLAGRPGLMTVQLHWDEAAADLNVDVFDSFGANVAASPGKSGQPAKKLLAQIDQPGKYYVRISSAAGASVYTFMARWAGGGGAAPVAAPSGAKDQVPNPAVPGAAAAPAAVAEDPDHPRARIVQSYRGERGQMVLYIDKGSDASVKPGMTGAILEGDTEKLLAGGSFQITRVVGPTKSIAESSVARVGKNSRVIINLR